MDRGIALSAYMRGFAKGADELRRSSGSKLDPRLHEHWKRGFDAGREMAEAMRWKYRRELEAGE